MKLIKQQKQQQRTNMTAINAVHIRKRNQQTENENWKKKQTFNETFPLS